MAPLCGTRISSTSLPFHITRGGINLKYPEALLFPKTLRINCLLWPARYLSTWPLPTSPVSCHHFLSYPLSSSLNKTLAALHIFGTFSGLGPCQAAPPSRSTPPTSLLLHLSTASLVFRYWCKRIFLWDVFLTPSKGESGHLQNLCRLWALLFLKAPPHIVVSILR